MTVVFADSSALVKLYADEADSHVVRECERFVTAQITRVEIPAALWKKQRMGVLTSRLTGALIADFEADWFGDEAGLRRFGVVRMTSLVLEDAARLTGVHGLRGYDAVQLASARAVRAADPSLSSLIVFDRHLRDAAATEGFTTVP